MTAYEGEYENFVGQITTAVAEAPLLLLLDPIGLKAIPAERIAPLIHRGGKTDVFLTLHFGIVHRASGFLDAKGNVVPKHGASAQVGNVDAFFNSQRWRQIMINAHASSASRDAVESDLLALFFSEVAGARYAFRSAYPVRSSAHDGPRYWLAHLCNHEKAFWLMNDLVAKVDAALLDKTYQDPDALPGLGASMVGQRHEASEHQLRKAILASLRQRHHATFGELRMLLAPDFFGLVREAAYARGVKTLVREGLATRQADNNRDALRPNEILRAVTRS